MIETDRLDDIPAGAVAEVIELKDDIRDTTHQKNSSVLAPFNGYLCRYLEQKGSTTLQRVERRTFTQRGLQFSHYSFAYEEIFLSDSAEFSDDPYAVAIRNLHLSVIPANLPCRTKELASLQQYILVGLRDRSASSPYGSLCIA